MSAFWSTVKAGAKTEAGKKIISKVVDYAVKKTPRKFKVAKTIKSQPPHTGTLKKTRKAFDELAGAASKGRDVGRYGPTETTNLLMRGVPGKGPHAGKMRKLHDIVTETGKIEQKSKKLSK